MSCSPFDVWMPIYIGDYLANTPHLTTERHGAYLLLMMVHRRLGSLPNDERQLAAIARLDVESEAWKRDWSVLKPFFSLREGGRLHLENLLKEKRRHVRRISDENGGAR